MKSLFRLSQFALEGGWLPDPVIRWGIRGLLKDKLKEERNLWVQEGPVRIQTMIEDLEKGPIAVNTREANEQHYELPTEFFQMVMGRHMKYSSCYWKEGVTDLDTAETDMLEITCRRADLKDGQSILELGCGWGSLTMFMAQKYPHSLITAVSNSKTQKTFIDGECRRRGLSNVRVITADMNDFWIDDLFDRVMSVEMFEHMRNHRKLLEKVSCFLKDDGRLFVHIFTHKTFAYLYNEKDESDWIARYFFTGGIMPSDNFFEYFDDQFQMEEHWQVEGTHYQKTAEAWLANMDRHQDKIVPIFQKTYGSDYKKWLVYWRVFFMSCAELWGYQGGAEWIVSHYRMKKTSAAPETMSLQHLHLMLRG